MSKQNEIDRQIESIERMVRALESAEHPALRDSARELVQALMSMHGACLERMLEIIGQAGALGQPLIESFARDEKVRSLLLLYDLHPHSLETRVHQALEKSRPYLHSHGGEVELVDIDDAGGVTLRLSGSCDGCHSSAAALKLAVENAIYEAAPDVSAIRVEGAIAEKTHPIAFLPLANLHTDSNHRHATQRSAQ